MAMTNRRVEVDAQTLAAVVGFDDLIVGQSRLAHQRRLGHVIQQHLLETFGIVDPGLFDVVGDGADGVVVGREQGGVGERVERRRQAGRFDQQRQFGEVARR